MNTTIEMRVRSHGERLLAIFPHATERDPVKLCKKLRRLEAAAHRAAEQYCNGEITDDDIDTDLERLTANADKLLDFVAGKIPVFINRDPRGHQFKICDEYMRKHNLDLQRDWGGYGIIAPDLSE